jgi:DNA mismatch endonuclease (patch repair protein)
MDNLSPLERSERMALVKNKNTKLELTVRRLIFAMGYRYRLHDSSLPGKPDLVFKSKGKVIFIHGCFWHRHKNCSLARLPKSNLDFWEPKLQKNLKRDKEVQIKLKKMKMKYLIIWECDIKNKERLSKQIIDFLENSK